MPSLHVPSFLPPPTVAGVRYSKTTRLHQLWHKVRREMGNGSLASDGLQWTDTSDSGSEGRWTPGRTPVAGSAAAGAHEEERAGASEDDADAGPVDVVVVENHARFARWTVGVGDDDGSDGHGAGSVRRASQAGGEHGHDARGPAASIKSSLRDFSSPWLWDPLRVVGDFVSCRAWPVVMDFFVVKYSDKETEEAFQKEFWFAQKSTHIAGALFVLFNYLFQIGLQQGTVDEWNRVWNYVIGPILSFFLICFAVFNVPRTCQWIWQLVLFLCVWMGSFGFLIDLYMCDYFGAHNLCQNRDFLTSFYYTSAFPLVGLFAMGQKRLLVFAGTLLWIIIACVLILPVHVNFLRDMLPWAVYMAFVLFFAYRREMSDRRTFTLRMELKVQFRAKQKAQINERKTQEAKRRYQNYIFHEVRVPLNTALLAVQNLKAANAFDKHDSEFAVEYSALDSSLTMMSTVLNDVLDFSKMEKGRFSSVNRPFSLHRMMRSILGPLKLDAGARGLDLVAALDPRLDEVAVKAMRGPGVVGAWKEGDGIVVGDEIRIRQIINNLASNASKFTNKGGRVTITTRLVHPALPRINTRRRNGTSDSTTITIIHQTSTEKDSKDEEQTRDLEMGDLSKAKPPDEGGEEGEEEEDLGDTLVVRIEVKDTGLGIRPKDVADGKMFSAYHQNDHTLLQGGKGTGLGLSLVRQIVSLSGGRLGVQSQVGLGSTFWIELPLGTISPETAAADLELVRSRNGMDGALGTPETPYGVQQGGEGADGYFGSGVSGGGTGGGEMESGGSGMAVEELLPKISLVPSVTTSVPSTDRPPIRALVVDDDLLTRKLMSRMLTRLGCEVSTAENGQVALDMLLRPEVAGEVREAGTGRGNYDVCYLDNQMPLVTGLGVVARLKELGRTDLVCGVTANAQLRDQEEYIQAGATCVLTKPVKEADLMRVLATARQKRTDEAGPPLPNHPLAS